MDHQQKTAVITGCSSGVGLHTSILLAKSGYKVYATLRNLDKSRRLRELAEKEQVSVELLQLDVQNEDSVHAAIEQVIQETGRLDVLVNNAGYGSLKALEQSRFSEIEEIMDVNFYGAVRCIRAALPHMRKRMSGHIVSVTSVGGLVGQPLNEVYCAAKFALEGLIESMATYLEPFFNIKMTLIEPAGIKSEFVNRVMKDLQSNPNPLQDTYQRVFDSYVNTSRKNGSFENEAQTPEQVAEIIAQVIISPTHELRVQTSEVAKKLAAEKLVGDPSGTKLQERIRKEKLGLV